MQNNEARDRQFEADLRVIQSNSVEPIVYQSKQNIVSSVSSYGGN